MCDCPFCPLIHSGLKVCDVKIRLPKKGMFLPTKAVLDDTINPNDKIHIVNIILWLKNTVKLPIGSSNRIDTDEMYCNVFRDRNNLFTFCFQSK